MRFYVAPSRAAVSQHIHVPAMGVHERMPPGLIRHGGRGSAHPVLIMLFHTPASVWPDSGGPPDSAHQRLVIWPYEAAHRYGHSSRPWDHTWLHVAGRWIDRALPGSTIPLATPIPTWGSAIVMRYFEMIYQELHGRARQDPDMLEGLVQLFLHDVARHRHARTAGRRPDARLEQARQEIEAHFDRPFSLAEAARRIHLSPSHFCACFTRCFGVPPRQYALRIRLHRAAQLLANRDLAVFQVAQIVGFRDPLYFSRLFHRRYGVSPSDFRRQPCVAAPSRRPRTGRG